MASTHVSLISAGGTNNRRIASSIYGYCTTPAATAAKTVSLYTGNSTTADGTWAAADLFHGLHITVRFQYANGVASPTLNVNGTGAKPIYRYDTTAPSTSAASSWQANAVVDFTYDTLLNSSGCWVMHSTWDNNTTYTNMTQTEATTGTATTARSISAKVLHNSIVELVPNNIVDGDSTGSVRQINTLSPNSTYSMGENAFAEGHLTIASGTRSHAQGFNTTASGNQSHAQGSGTTVSQDYGHVEGYNSTVSGIYGHAEGQTCTASNSSSHAEGSVTTASGSGSHSEGSNTTASGNYSHAEGFYTTASGSEAHAEGSYTIAFGNNQHVQGKYNISSSTYAHIVGNGTGESSRSNAHTLDWDGNAWYAGKVTAGANAVNAMDLVTLQQLQAALPSSLSSYHVTIGNGTDTSFTVSHNLNTKNILVSINITDNNITYIAPLTNLSSIGQIGYSVTISNNDSIVISFTSAPASNAAEVSVISAIAYSSASDENLLKI